MHDQSLPVRARARISLRDAIGAREMMRDRFFAEPLPAATGSAAAAAAAFRIFDRNKIIYRSHIAATAAAAGDGCGGYDGGAGCGYNLDVPLRLPPAVSLFAKGGVHTGRYHRRVLRTYPSSSALV